MSARPEDDDAAETVTGDRFPSIDDAAETIVVDRELGGETIVVDREVEGETVVVDREVEGETIVVARDSAPADSPAAMTRERPSFPAPGRGRRRRGMTMPPVPSGFGRGAVDASGPGAVATYEPRAIPDLPAPPTVYPGVEATRVPEVLPSVRRRSRRAAIITLALFAAACIVSVVGLLGLGLGLALFR